jgi:hypothetical protein
MWNRARGSVVPNRPVVIMAALAAFAPLAALATPARTATVQPPKGAPIADVSCAVETFATGANIAVRVRNIDASRTLRRLAVSVALADDVGVRRAVVPHTFEGADLAPGDTAEFKADDITVPLDSTVRRTLRAATCRFVSATYDGGATWKPGKRWRGKLIAPDAGPSP